MMIPQETYTFLQIKPFRGLVFTVVYLVVAISLLAMAMGGFDRLAAFVHNFGSNFGIGLLGAVVLLVPAFLLIRLIYPKITVRLDGDSLSITKHRKETQVIRYDAVWKITLNVRQLNVLELWDQQDRLLGHFKPLNNSEVLRKMIDAITGSARFVKSRQEKRIFKSSYEALTYVRSHS
ncbi:hypothetical protein DBR32_01325 [Taibaiella sp. KBW10]|uniref:hypothetical protein n=1 Tax=Taibaiella sp. KBW10 TaxID=2153357 RepID=UPI000F59E9E1|nr:hypothetical protein [Taibaiella sp. KBW10]RQO32279.1 hypothetical protein DBR32_01325 [Taibaiella sp. KBW10]